MKTSLAIVVSALTLAGPALPQQASTDGAAAPEAKPAGWVQDQPLTQTITDIITDPPEAAAADAAASALTDPAAPRLFAAGDHLGFTDGKDIYQYFCRGCHQYDGAGAKGAGAYPALAGNENLEFGDYPVTLVVNGQKGMPPFGHLLSDEQVVAVVTYIQTSFGNSYTEHPTVETVAAVRPADQSATAGGAGGN